MKAKIQITNPLETEFTLNVTMTLTEWMKLKDQLNKGKEHHHAQPAFSFISHIDYAIVQARKEFVGSETE